MAETNFAAARAHGVGQDRLHVVLGQIDHERVPRLRPEDVHPQRKRAAPGRALDLADLVDAQRFGEDRVRDTVTPPDFERAG
jgi:hypothetical protein